MFDGDFLNICGVWEKSISLLMKIALFFIIIFRKLLGFLTFFFPVLLLYLYAGYIEKCRYDYKYKYKSEFPDKVSAWWVLIFSVVLLTHWIGGPFYGIILKECMRSLTIGWLRLNLILVLALVGLQAYVSYLYKVGFLRVPHRFDIYFVALSKYFNFTIYTGA